MLKQIVADALKKNVGHTALATELERNGLSLRAGERAGEWVVMKGEQFIASVRRLAGLRKDDFLKLTEAWSDDICRGAAGPGDEDARRRRDADPARGNSGRTEIGERVQFPSDGGRHSISSGGRPGSSAGFRVGAASGDPGTGGRRGGEKGYLGRLKETIEAATLRARDSSAKADALARTDAIYVEMSLSRAERQAKKRIAEAQRGAVLSAAPVEAAAKEASARYRELHTLARHVSGLSEHRAELSRKVDGARFWQRWRHEAEWKAEIARIDEQRQALTNRQLIAEGKFLNAGAAHARIESDYRTAAAVAEKDAETAIAIERQALTVIDRTRRLLNLWPAFAYMGPVACQRLGQAVEKTRRQLRNPEARDIWGLPLNFGG
jgi:hypothetical protein